MTALSSEAMHALEMAMQSEIDTVQIYRHIQKKVKNSRSQNMLNWLIEEEYKHEKHIKDKIRSMGMTPPEPEIDPEVLPNREQIMDIELENCSASELLDLAIENERISRDFYRAQQERAENEEVKKVFEWLVEQEEEHLRNLKSVYEEKGAGEGVRVPEDRADAR